MFCEWQFWQDRVRIASKDESTRAPLSKSCWAARAFIPQRTGINRTAQEYRKW